MNAHSLTFSLAYSYGHLARQQRGVFLEVMLAPDAISTRNISVQLLAGVVG